MADIDLTTYRDHPDRAVRLAEEYRRHRVTPPRKPEDIIPYYSALIIAADHLAAAVLDRAEQEAK